MLDASWLKVIAFFGVWAAIWMPIASVLYRLFDWRPDQTITPQQKIILVMSLYILAPIVLGWKFRVENLSFASLGLSLQPNIFVSLLLGLFLGIVSLIVTFWGESILSLVNWRWENSQKLIDFILPILALSLFISTVEELIFRGYIFNTLVRDYSYWLAAIISSAIFALLHLIWERKDTLPQIPGLWLMGMILILARAIDDGSLGLAIGLHAGWVWGLTCIDSAELITYQQQNSWIAGLNRQPLAGIAGIFCLLLTGFILWLMANSSTASIFN